MDRCCCQLYRCFDPILGPHHAKILMIESFVHVILFDFILLTSYRFILSLSSCAKCMVIDDQLNILPISSHVTAITPVPPKTKVSLPFLIGWLTCHSHMLATTVVMAHIYTYTHTHRVSLYK